LLSIDVNVIMTTDNSDNLENDRNNLIRQFNLNQPLLFTYVENAEVTLHYQHNTQQLWCIKVSSDSGSIHPVENSFAISEIGKQQIIYGPLPAGVLSIVATSEGITLPVQVENSVFLLQTSIKKKVQLTFLGPKQTIIQRVVIPTYFQQKPDWVTRLRDFGQKTGVYKAKRQVTYPHIPNSETNDPL
jgi:hypothetical protein